MARWIVVALILAAGTSFAAEKIYKWTDADGGVHFSATPPPGQAVESQDLHYFRSDPAAAAAAQKQQQDQILQRRDSESKATQAAVAASGDAATRQQQCEQARGIIGRMQGDPMRKYKQDDGTYRRLTDDERAKNLGDAQASAQQNCD